MGKSFTPEGSEGIHKPGADELTEKTGLSPFALAIATARRARRITDSRKVTPQGGVVYTETVLPNPGTKPPVTLAIHELDTGLIRVTNLAGPPLPKQPKNKELEPDTSTLVA